MSLRIYKITALLAIVLSAACWFIDFRISLGIILAAAVSFLNMFLRPLSMKQALDQNSPFASLLTGMTMLRFVLLGLGIFVALKNPQLFSIVGVTVGLTLFLAALVIDALRRKG